MHLALESTMTHTADDGELYSFLYPCNSADAAIGTLLVLSACRQLKLKLSRQADLEARRALLSVLHAQEGPAIDAVLDLLTLPGAPPPLLRQAWGRR
jgi:hypothetical protein